MNCDESGCPIKSAVASPSLSTSVGPAYTLARRSLVGLGKVVPTVFS